jgi:hypothetical protein
MREAVQYIGWLVGIPLEILIIAALLRGSAKRFPLLLLYMVVLFLATIVQIPAYTAYFSGRQLAHTRAFYYWSSATVLQALVFGVVVSFIYEATAQAPHRRLVRPALVAGAIVYAAASFLIHYDSRLARGAWMTPWSRDINFVSAIFDLALWALLIASTHKDRRLLMLTAALGIQFTGEAIGQSLRRISPSVVFPGNVLILLANLACLYIWWQALRAVPVRRQPGATL